MKKLLIATTNPGKLFEIKFFLSDLPLELVSLTDLEIKDSPEESGQTFEENAILKAKFYCQISGLPTLADDGGLEIDFLNAEPGVKSRRWINGVESSDEELINYTLEKMRGLPRAQRGAQLRTVIALVLPNGKTFTNEGKVRGVIAEEAYVKRTPGFPYRSLLFLPEINKFYYHEDLTDKEKKLYSHRGKVLQKLKKIILENM